jgi:hypothetical protein
MTRRAPRSAPIFFALLLAIIVAAGIPAALHAAPEAIDVLVYKDGDRVQGRFISDDGKLIVFRSNRFGELSVPSSQAEVIYGSIPAAAPAQTAATPAPSARSTANAKNDAELAEERLVIGRLSAALRRFFGPWHGRVSFSSEAVNASDSRQNEVLEGRMNRKWVADDVQLSTRYEFSSTNEITNTDVTKGSVYWRHDLSRRWFTIVHPSLEWNRNYVYQNQAADYVLLQEELGGGFAVWDRPNKKLRLGLANNVYDVWNTSGNGHTTRNVESVFVEAEFGLPWNLKLTERAIQYFSLNGGSTGSESQFELSKKFSENLVLAIRHEVRDNLPDIHVQNYSSWRLLLGLDF